MPHAEVETDVIEREAARVLLINPSGAILLQELAEFREEEDIVPTGTFWITPGGGLAPGETHEEAALRELREECGCSSAVLGPCVWTRTSGFRFRGRSYIQRERFYTASASPFELDQSALDDLEVGVVLGHRWWSLDAIEGATGTAFYPRHLGPQLRRLLTDGPPAEPIDVGD